MKKTFAVLLLLATTLFAQAQGRQAKYERENDILYTTSSNQYAQERCKLDVYYPTDLKDVPVVVWFHGGGIEGGNKHIDQELQRSGLTVVAANYRLLPKASIDEVLDDAACAVAWAFKNAEKYNGSKKKIFVAGHSAGGYLLDIIGLDKKWLAKYGVDADSIAGLIPFSGQVITHYNIRKQQNIGPLQATIDQYAPLTYVRKDCPPMVIISGDRELELYGRYEEQAYFWRMLKLTGHPDVTLYEMQGYDHGAMPQPAYKVMKDHIKRIVNSQISAMPTPNIKTEQQAQYSFTFNEAFAHYGATIDNSKQIPVLNLGSNDGYYDLTAETGALIQNLKDFTVSVYYKVDSANKLDGYGHFLFAFSKLVENKADDGPYMAMRLNEQRFETSTGGYEHEQIVMQGGKPKRDVWVHALFRQQSTKGELYLDGKLIGTNNNMPILSEIFKEAPAYCWLGRAPFKGDKYLTDSHIADFRIYNYAVNNKELQELNKKRLTLDK